MQQKQNIKGFTLLELLVIIAIIGVVAGMGLPQFEKWSIERLVRTQAEKVASILSVASTQVERGSYPYVRVEFETDKLITVKGIDATTLSNKLNANKKPTCVSTDMDGSDTITSLSLDEDVYVYHLVKNAAICFSKGGKYFKQFGSADSQLNSTLDKVSDTNNLIVICYKRVKTCNPVTKTFEPKGDKGNYPVYLVKYSRFGIINKYKYSYEKNDYINQ